jgi:hypothetical protein
MSDLKNIIEGVITGSSDQKKSAGTPGNDNLPKVGPTPASKAPKMKGKPGKLPAQTTTVTPTGGVTLDDTKKAAHQTKKGKEPQDAEKTGDRTQPVQGSSKTTTPDNKKLGEEEMYDETDETEELVEDEDTFELPSTKGGMAKLVFDMLRSMDKDDLDERYVDILSAILNEEEEEEEADGTSDEDYAIAREARTRITSEDIDISEDVTALLSDNSDELSDEFMVKAATIFEAAVVSKINEEIDRLEQDFASEISEARAEFEGELTNKVDGYLSYVVEEWMKDNELAVERGIRSELTEDFITGLKDLFTQNYIDIPDEKVDVVDELANRVSQLEAELNESIELAIDLSKSLNGHEREEVLYSMADGLADTEFEKLKGLAEGVDFEDTDQYQQALVTLKESYFPRAPRTVDEEDTDELLSESLGSSSSSSMDSYSRAIGRTIRH